MASYDAKQAISNLLWDRLPARQRPVHFDHSSLLGDPRVAQSDAGEDGPLDEEAAAKVTPRPRERSCLDSLARAVKSFQDVPFVFFVKYDDTHLINKAILYVRDNEQTNKIIVVHCSNNNNGSDNITDTASLTEHVKLMDMLYPRVKISLLVIHSPFCAVTVEWLSQALDVPINAMFISCPDENFAMKVSQLRGMRIIFSYD